MKLNGGANDDAHAGKLALVKVAYRMAMFRPLRNRLSLDKIDQQNTSAWIGSLGGSPRGEQIEFDRSIMKRLSDEDLAELATRERDPKARRLAQSELQNRESWRTPAKWALVIATLSFALSVTAFMRTL